MTISLDIMRVKSIEFGKVVERSSYSTRTITVTTESGEEFEINLYANDNEQGESGQDKLRFSI